MAFSTNDQTFTDAQMLAKIRRSIVSILDGGQSVNTSGTGLIRASLGELRKMEEDYQNRVNLGSSGGIGLVQYGERS